MQAGRVISTQRAKSKWMPVLLALFLSTLPDAQVLAGGGLVLEGDSCIIRIDFYSAHFTAYQPDTSGNEQFCRDLPNTGTTIFVLDYLHQSMKEVPVDFRIIKNMTGLGGFVKLKNIVDVEDIEKYTVFYQEPVIRADASFKIEYDFIEKGEYIGIVSVGHPSNDTIYTAIFPFEVGAVNYTYWILLIIFLGGTVIYFYRRFIAGKSAALSSDPVQAPTS